MKDEERTQASLAFLVDGDNFLLGIKQRKIGAGSYNGYGGRLDPVDGGDIDKTMVRETEEEIGVTPKVWQKMAELAFDNFHSIKELRHMLVHVYFVAEWSGEPTESEEMKDLKWFKVNEIPFNKMQSGDAFCLKPVIEESKKIKAHVEYDENGDFVKSESYLTEVNSF